jgi:hypothetical protein
MMLLLEYKTLRRCNRCAEEKPLSEFQGQDKTCRDCEKELSARKQWEDANDFEDYTTCLSCSHYLMIEDSLGLGHCTQRERAGIWPVVGGESCCNLWTDGVVKEKPTLEVILQIFDNCWKILRREALDVAKLQLLKKSPDYQKAQRLFRWES